MAGSDSDGDKAAAKQSAGTGGTEDRSVGGQESAVRCEREMNEKLKGCTGTAAHVNFRLMQERR